MRAKHNFYLKVQSPIHCLKQNKEDLAVGYRWVVGESWWILEADVGIWQLDIAGGGPGEFLKNLGIWPSGVGVGGGRG